MEPEKHDITEGCLWTDLIVRVARRGGGIKVCTVCCKVWPLPELRVSNWIAFITPRPSLITDDLLNGSFTTQGTVSGILPQSELGSCVVCGYVWENPGRWLCFCPWSVVACCQWRCTFLCAQPRHWGAEHKAKMSIMAGPQRELLTKSAKYENLALISNIHLAQELGNKCCTCSAPGRGPCLQCELLMSGWWRWGQGECTLVLPCQATECSDTGPRCAHLASPLGSPSDPRTREQTCDARENTMQTLHSLFYEGHNHEPVHPLF